VSSVADGMQTNRDIIGRGMKGIVNSANKAEENVDEGKLVPGKGSYKSKIITIPRGKE